jgi:hypothetical protein
MHNNFIRVPPDGVGKRSMANRAYVLFYKNASSDFRVNDIVVGSGSGISCYILRVDKQTNTSGILYLRFIDDDNDVEFIDNELLMVGGISYAFANGIGYPMYYQMNTIVDFNNPFTGMTIDNKGQALVAFSEGEQQFDSWGSSKQSTNLTVSTYKNIWDATSALFYDETIGNGNISISSNIQELIITTGSTSGDMIRRTSHKYHRRIPGTGQLCVMEISLGDTGKTNVLRR